VTAAPLLEIRSLVKAHGALRPLRIRELVVRGGEAAAIGGLDQQAAEVFVHLATGGALPDEGSIRVFGRDTRDIADVQAWLRSLDALGVMSPRAILVDPLTVRQNLAIAFTLDVDPIPLEVWGNVEALLRLTGIGEPDWDRPAGSIDAVAQYRLRLARAIALRPALLIAEHPSAGLPRGAVPALAAELAAVAVERRFALLAITADDAFAAGIGGRRLQLNAATGELTAPSGLLDRMARLFR
jgi:predicted ABC-type transport system involved in lysophospholipase L1 biosynthesis ATPase subunit